MANAIPPGVTADDVYEAARLIDGGFEHGFGVAIDYEMILEQRKYAPKAVMGVAIWVRYGRTVGPKDFRSGTRPKEAVGYLRELGFVVEPIAQTYLFTCVVESWPEFSDLRRQLERDPSATEFWNSNGNKHIPTGARFFLMKQGELPRGIIGAGWTVCGTTIGISSRKPAKKQKQNELRFEQLFSGVDDRILLVDQLPAGNESLWHARQSGRAIPRAVAESVERQWDHLLSTFESEKNDSLESNNLEATEGRRRLVRHYRVERCPALVEAKKRCVMKSETRLACAGCGFDFNAVYGSHGQGFCECHHVRPLLEGQRITRLEDLELVCANCHRMIHYGPRMLGMEELRKLIVAQKP